MLDSYNQQEIAKISYEILKHSKALDVFPTPVNKIVQYSNLIIETGIDVSKIETSFFEKIGEGAKSIFSKIRGILDRKEKIIYLDLGQSPSRKNFVKLHETGHDVIPWQKNVLECLDDDNTLSHLVKEEFEAEANFFASLTLFQHDRFHYQMKRLELGIQASMHLAKVFGSSIHAALRKYVETSTKRCALLILEKGIGLNPFECSIKDFFQSEKFSLAFGELNWPEQLDYSYSFVEDYISRRRFRTDGTTCLKTKNGECEFVYHYFNNSYNAFVLIFPLGENKKTNTKIIITGINDNF